LGGQEIEMRRSSSAALMLTIAVAFSTGAVLVRPPMPKGLAPGAYSDIVIVQDEANSKSARPTDSTTPPPRS